MNKFIQKGKLRKSKLSLLTPENSGLKLIVNPLDADASFTNNVNKQIATRWKKAKEEGRSWFMNQTGYKVGEFRHTSVQSDIWVVNLYCLNKEGLSSRESLEAGFKNLLKFAKTEKASIHLSSEFLNLGFCEELVTKYFLDEGINVYAYEN